MRIHILSDLHLEFGPLPDELLPSRLRADLHLLAGDIGVGDQGVAWALKNLEAPTAYVFGNHEHYRNLSVERSVSKARQLCAGTHLSVLDRHELTLAPGIRVLGATLWTGFDLFGNAKRDLDSIEHARLRMSDYRQISDGFLHGHDDNGEPLPGPHGRGSDNPRIPFTPERAIGLHRESVRWLDAQLSIPFDGKTIVVSHHAPSPQSLLYQQAAGLLDGAYASDLEWLMSRHQIDLWAHGHTHVPCDYMVGSTRVVSNPRGYFPSALVDCFDPALIIEI